MLAFDSCLVFCGLLSWVLRRRQCPCSLIPFPLEFIFLLHFILRSRYLNFNQRSSFFSGLCLLKAVQCVSLGTVHSACSCSGFQSTSHSLSSVSVEHPCGERRNGPCHAPLFPGALIIFVVLENVLKTYYLHYWPLAGVTLLQVTVGY